MDAIDLLERQHREIERLFKKAESAKGEAKAGFVAQIADKLAVHATIEEKIFYPGSIGERTEEMLREAVEEHLAAKRICADLLECDVDDPQYDAKVSVLKEILQHHIEEEESQLFPRVKRAFGRDMLEEFGEEMQALAEDLIDEGEPRYHIPQETARPAPL